jgi:hypothetical protein
MTRPCTAQPRRVRQPAGQSGSPDTSSTPWWAWLILSAAAISFCIGVLLLLILQGTRVALNALSRSSDTHRAG